MIQRLLSWLLKELEKGNPDSYNYRSPYRHPLDRDEDYATKARLYYGDDQY